MLATFSKLKDTIETAIEKNAGFWLTRLGKASITKGVITQVATGGVYQALRFQISSIPPLMEMQLR